MDKSNFSEDTRYTLTVKDSAGKQRPANVFVYRTHEDFMIARATDKDGLIIKIAYSDVMRIVKEQHVEPNAAWKLAEVTLSAETWADRDHMRTYSTSSGIGK
mgnify:CR=1 FL=1